MHVPFPTWAVAVVAANGATRQRLDDRGVWMLPSLRGRLTYCVRLGVTIGLTCAWVFSTSTLQFFTPGVLVTLAATSCAKPTLGSTLATSADFILGVGLAIVYALALLELFPAGASVGLQTWWLNLVLVVAFTASVAYSKLPALAMKLAVAVNAVVLLSTYLAFVGPRERSNSVAGSTAVGVVSALVGACVPWLDLATQHDTVRTRFACSNAFAVAAALTTSLDLSVRRHGDGAAVGSGSAIKGSGSGSGDDGTSLDRQLRGAVAFAIPCPKFAN